MRNLLYILKHDRQAAMLLLVVFLALGVFMLEFCTEDKTNKETESVVETEHKTTKKEYYAVPTKEIHLQPFDPNTADSTVLLGLGLQSWQVRSIYKYRAAGGVYSRPEDFAQLYGLSLKKYKELRPYIRIGKEYRPAAESVALPQPLPRRGAVSESRVMVTDYNGNSFRPTKLKAGQTISVNASDTLQLQRVPGIGPYYARKIARLRDQLGGIVSKEQLLDIEGFPESALPYLTIEGTIRKLNVNKASAEQLRKHPYITYMMAREIINYRRVHGNIQNIDDLSLLPEFTKETINKLRPYIEY